MIALLSAPSNAVVVGRHRAVLADIVGRRPYVDPARTAHGGCRDDDFHLFEATQLLATVWPSSSISGDVAGAVRALRRGAGDGFGFTSTSTSLVRPSSPPSTAPTPVG